MSRFTEMIDGYCALYGVSKGDRTRLLLHYPLFKAIHTMEYGHGLSQAAARSLVGLASGYRMRHTIHSVALAKPLEVTLPFDRCDFGSFKEVFMEACYALPSEVSDVRSFVDLGGNTGMASLYFLTQFPDLKKAIIVEANPNLLSKINANLSAFSDQVQVENVCISNGKSASITFHVSSNHRHSHADGTKGEDNGVSVEIPSLTVRQLMQKHGLAEADLLKMDIEGAEYQVLEDKEALRLFRFLLIEVHGKTGERNQFVQQVQEVGFQVAERHFLDDDPCETIFCSRLSRDKN